jgi:hypothetical protein
LATNITTSPTQAVAISPEALEVANCFLATQDMQQVAEQLEIPLQIMSRREVKAYIDHVFIEAGFNNRFKIREIMDVIIKKKMQELDEADIGSTKDIADLLALSHKMTMEHLDKQIALEKIRASAPQTQVNIQENNYGDSKYGKLLHELLGK